MRKGIYGCPYLKHLIELCPGYWEENWLILMNWFLRRINININMGRHGLLRNFLKMSPGNLFGALFWNLPTGRKDIVFGGKVTDMAKKRKKF